MSSEGENGRPKRGRLSGPDYHHLCEWLARNAERLMRDKPLYSDAAAEATRELGVNIVPKTMCEAGAVTGVVWRSASARPGGIDSGRKVRPSVLAALEGKVDRLAMCICELLRAMGVPVPPGTEG